MNKILLICFLALPFLVGAQNIKIGDISISDSLAKEYFLDCYQKPDTIPDQPISPSAWFNFKLKQSIGRYDPSNSKKFNHFQEFIIVPREPSAADFRDWYLRRSKKK